MDSQPPIARILSHQIGRGAVELFPVVDLMMVEVAFA